MILLGCDAGEFQERRSTNEEISRVLKIGMRKVDRVKKRFIMVFNTPSACGGVIPLNKGPGLALGFNTLY